MEAKNTPDNSKAESPKPVGLKASKNTKWAAAASLLIPAIVVVGLLFLLISLRSGSEAAMARLADLLPVGYAFSAGMVASVNPCGFLLLPTYILYHLGAQEDDFYTQPANKRVLKALYLGLAATLGFVTIFGLVGVAVTAGGQWLLTIFPYTSIVLGVGMVGLGLWLLVTKKSIGIQAASRVTIAPKRNLWNVFVFGIVYAVGSLSCTLPVFLVVVGSALSSQDLSSSLGQFLGYALGMASVFIVVTVGVALVRDAMTRWFKSIVPYVYRMNALFLVAVGLYLIYTWFSQGPVLF
ncbi:MAG: cytochrome c biogenesis protein CcdA [Anaerolineae bacterium]|nr:cytochrome c biogenesis protein CcdA [Anaerolineae bacterium]